jgi:hypothetical protein
MGVERIISFANWAADHPSDRLPADRLDSQFDLVANAIHELETRVSRLLRADGKLAHNLLTAASFPPELHEEMARKILAQVQEERVAIQRAAMAIGQTRREIVELLHDAKVFAAEQVEEYARSLDLIKSVVAVQEQLETRLEPLAVQARDASAVAGLASNVATLTAEASENWAQVSMEWAEHMPDTIPPNILATNAVTGDHWSSRWWANQAATAVGGFLYHFYLGPFPSPPTSLPSGGAIPPGAIYFDTTTGTMWVFNGATWVPFSTPQPAGTSAQFYAATADQTVFPLTVPDLTGRTVTLNAAKNEGIEVFVNGVRLTPNGGSFVTGDYTVNKATSTITIAGPVSLNSIVAVDVLKDPVDLAVVGVVKMKRLKKFVFDGVATTFALLDANTSAPVTPVTDTAQVLVTLDGVSQEPGVDYSLAAAGASIQFSSAPTADAKNFAIYYSAT